MEYCVAIRTLGTAGEKYQTLLDSLNRQTIRPKRILVYIPDGYDLPKETIGWEKYIRSPKGMITQRSLPFDEIDSEYILFCDDDLWLADDFVEKMFAGLQNYDADCISPDVFKVQSSSLGGVIKKAISGYAFPRKDDGWAFKITRNGGYTYNRKPKEDVLPSESAAGACALIKKQAYKDIHFEDERWMESFGYPLGEDLLFFYKLHSMGKHVLVHFNAGIKHLDAGAGKQVSSDAMRKGVALSLVVSHRIRFRLQHVTFMDKLLWCGSNILRHLEQYLFVFFKGLLKEKRLNFFDYWGGFFDAYHYIHSNAYQQLPKFDAYKR